MLRHLIVSSEVRKKLEQKKADKEIRLKLDSHREKAAKKAFIQKRLQDKESSLNANLSKYMDSLEVKSLLSEIVASVEATAQLQDNSASGKLPTVQSVPATTSSASGLKRKVSHDFRSWIDRAHAIYMFLHPKVYQKKTATDSAQL